MSPDEHPLDAAAKSLESLAHQPVADREPSPDFWELDFAADESVGDYPQAVAEEDEDWDEESWDDESWDDDEELDDNEGLGPDGFPLATDGLPKLTLQESAKWTDVLSSSLWSEGYLFNDKARAPFVAHQLGEFREYPASVADVHGEERKFTFLFIRNLVPPAAIDFERSEFYVEDTLGRPRTTIEVNSLEQWSEAVRRASEGEIEGCDEFSSVAYKTLYFKPQAEPQVDLFRLEKLGIRVYISTRLKEALVAAGITGLEIRPNRRLFVSNR